MTGDLDALWEHYRTVVLPETLPPAAVAFARLAFYGGAGAALLTVAAAAEGRRDQVVATLTHAFIAFRDRPDA